MWGAQQAQDSGSSARSPPISPVAPQASDQLAAKPKPQTLNARTLILLDWDDTLLPARVSTRFVRSAPPPKVAASLRLLSQDVIGLLNACSAHGHVMIVTNAMNGWVESSSRQLMPDVLKHIRHQHITIVSAQEQFAATRRRTFRSTDPMEWKVACFGWIVDRLASTTSDNGAEKEVAAEGLTLVSIGDSMYERVAAKTLAAQGKIACCKTVKFVEEPQPTIAQLRRQIASLRATLETIVNISRSIDIDLEL